MPRPRPASILNTTDFSYIRDPHSFELLANDPGRDFLRSRVMSMPEDITRYSDYSIGSSSNTYRGVSSHHSELHSIVPNNRHSHQSWPSSRGDVIMPRTIQIGIMGSDSDDSLFLEKEKDTSLPSISVFSPSEDEESTIRKQELSNPPVRRSSTLKTRRVRAAPEKGQHLSHAHDPFPSSRIPTRITSAPVTLPAIESLVSLPEQSSSNDSLFSIESTESSHIEPGRSMASLLSRYGKLPCGSQMLDSLLQCEEVTSIYEDDESSASVANDNTGRANLIAHAQVPRGPLTDLGSAFTPSHQFDDDYMSVASLYSVACGTSEANLAPSDYRERPTQLQREPVDYRGPPYPTSEAHNSNPCSTSNHWGCPNFVKAPSSPLEQLSMVNLMNQPAEAVGLSATGDYYINDENTGLPLRVSGLIVRNNKPIVLHKADSATASITTDALNVQRRGLASTDARASLHSPNFLVSMESKKLAALSRHQWSDCSSNSMAEKRLSACVDVGEHYLDSRFKIDDYTLGRGHNRV